MGVLRGELVPGFHPDPLGDVKKSPSEIELFCGVPSHADLAVLDRGQSKNREAGADERHEHVRLRIPHVSLGAKEFVRPLSRIVI